MKRTALRLCISCWKAFIRATASESGLSALESLAVRPIAPCFRLAPGHPCFGASGVLERWCHLHRRCEPWKPSVAASMAALVMARGRKLGRHPKKRQG